ncbi:MAG: hypothetical protein RL398_1583 [Planctomycetota bacterium]
MRPPSGDRPVRSRVGRIGTMRGGFLGGRPAWHFAQRGSQTFMGKRLYVGNLPYDADEDGLRELFAQDGRRVERVHIVLDRETQRPRGFAFVEMATDDEAQAAVGAMDGALYGTRAMRVSEAEDRRGPGGPGGGPGGPGGPRGPGGGFDGPRGPRPDRAPMGREDGPRPPSGPRPAGPGPATGPRPAPSGGGWSGGGGGGGGWSGGGGGGDRQRHFGPDAKPKRERDKEYGKKPKRRGEGDVDSGRRRGGGGFDDDDDEY